MVKITLWHILTFSMLIPCLSSCACQPEASYPWPVDEESSLNLEENSPVTLSLEPDSLTLTSGRFILHNGGEEKVFYGNEFSIQVHTRRQWRLIEKYSDWTLEAYTVLPGESAILDLDWSQLYGELPASEYRLILHYRAGPSLGPECSLKYASCEFTIADN